VEREVHLAPEPAQQADPEQQPRGALGTDRHAAPKAEGGGREYQRVVEAVLREPVEPRAKDPGRRVKGVHRESREREPLCDAKR